MIKNISIGLCINFFLFNALTNALADDETLKIFTDAISVIEKNHIDQPSLKELVLNAVRGIEEVVAQRVGKVEKIKITWEGIKENDKELIRLYEKAYNFYRKNTPIPEKELLYAAINGSIKYIDPNSSLLSLKELETQQKNLGGVGIQIIKREGALTVVSAIEGTPAFKAGIKSADRILMIGDKPTENISLQEALQLLRGSVGTKVTLVVMREGFDNPQPFEITRGIFNVPAVESKVLEGGIGYIRITHFKEGTDGDLINVLKDIEKSSGGLKKLILDLRDNPGGLLNQAAAVSNLFLDSGRIVTYIKGRGQLTKFHTQTKGPYSVLPVIIILINSGTASAAEIVASALHENQRAFLVGSKTFGRGAISTIFPLKDGSALRLTTNRYYTPLGQVFEVRGIEPDVKVAEKGLDDKPLYTAILAFKKLSDAEWNSKEMFIQLLKAIVEKNLE